MMSILLLGERACESGLDALHHGGGVGDDAEFIQVHSEERHGERGAQTVADVACGQEVVGRWGAAPCSREVMVERQPRAGWRTLAVDATMPVPRELLRRRGRGMCSRRRRDTAREGRPPGA